MANQIDPSICVPPPESLLCKRITELTEQLAAANKRIAELEEDAEESKRRPCFGTLSVPIRLCKMAGCFAECKAEYERRSKP